MQIDVLSSNTLKLTLSSLDMFDLDIKYESLSGKNPETKRLLAHVLKSIQLDREIGLDFSGERLFVEAFPRSDGGCMLYISSLETDDIPRRGVRNRQYYNDTELQNRPQKTVNASYTEICEMKNLKSLGKLCKSLCWQHENNRLDFKSSLYQKNNTYRLVITGDNKSVIHGISSEFGKTLSKNLINETKEHYKVLIIDNAAQILSNCI